MSSAAIRTYRVGGMTNSGSPVLLALLLVFGFGFCFSFAFGYGLAFCSANFRKEGLSCGWSRYFAQQQSPRSDLVSIHRVSGVTVLADRRTFQGEPREHTLGAGVGQDFRVHLPIRTGLGMPSNWPCGRGSVRSNVEITFEQLLHPFFILNDQHHVHRFHSDRSVPASACRPTGPAAAEASAPTWKLLSSSFCIPFSF